MPAITLKNIPDELYDQIRKSARENYRSIVAEILFRLHTSLGQAPHDREALVQRLLTVRTQRALPPLTDKLLSEAKGKGRP
jgi:antitoxin FitA